MKYLKWWLISLSLVVEFSPLKCIRLIALFFGIIIRIGDRNYVIYLGLPKYCIMLTNEKSHLFGPEYYFFKRGHFYIMHVIGTSIRKKVKSS